MSEPAQIDPIRQTSIQTISPRTKIARQGSSRNAIRHGIFSEVVVLPDESLRKYRSLLKGFWDALQPEGRVEEFLVETLAMLGWRHRRLLVAEGAEIRQGTEFLEWDQRALRARTAEEQEAQIFASTLIPTSEPEFIRKVQDGDLLERRLELLRELRQEINSSGFDEERDLALLDKIYGSDASLRENLRGIYRQWALTAEAPEEERQREGYASPKECKKNVAFEIQAEIARLQKYQRERSAIESERTKLDAQRRKVPESEKLDRLLRYEAHLSREFGRTLNQLDRLQRQRRGQPAAPRLDVNVCT